MMQTPLVSGVALRSPQYQQTLFSLSANNQSCEKSVFYSFVRMRKMMEPKDHFEHDEYLEMRQMERYALCPEHHLLLSENENENGVNANEYFINPNVWALKQNEKTHQIENLDLQLQSVLRTLDDDEKLFQQARATRTNDMQIVQQQQNTNTGATLNMKESHIRSDNAYYQMIQGGEHGIVHTQMTSQQPQHQIIAQSEQTQTLKAGSPNSDFPQNELPSKMVPDYTPQYEIGQQHSTVSSHSASNAENESHAMTPFQMPGMRAEKNAFLYVPLPKKNYKGINRAELVSIIKAQMSQLQPSDLLANDFYFQVYNARKGGRVSDFSNVLPAVAQMNAVRQTYGNYTKHLHAEATLGKLQTSDLRKPKKIMDFNSMDASPTMFSSVAAERNMFSDKIFSYLIEEGIRLLMDIEDVDSQLQLVQTPNERQLLFTRRHQFAESLADSLDIFECPADMADSNHLVFQFWKSSKGRLLIFRSLLLMPPPLSAQLVAILLIDLPLLIEMLSGSATDDHLISAICDTVYSQNMMVANDLFKRFLSEPSARNIVGVIKSKLGALLLQVFLKKGHETVSALTNAKKNSAPPEIVQMIERDAQAFTQFFQFLISLLDGQWENLMMEVAAPLAASTEILYEAVAAIVSHAKKDTCEMILKQLANRIDRDMKVLQPHIKSNALSFLWSAVHSAH